MIINPVQSFGTESGTQFPAAKVRVSRPQASPLSVTVSAQEQRGSGTLPNQEVQRAQKVAAESEGPQDVVHVQHDSQIADEVIIKYTVEATGRVILQVPSAEVLGVARGSHRIFDKRRNWKAALLRLR